MAFYPCNIGSSGGLDIQNVEYIKMSDWINLSNPDATTLYNVTNESMLVTLQRFVGDKPVLSYISESDFNSYEFWYEDVNIPSELSGTNSRFNTGLEINNSDTNKKNYELRFKFNPSSLSSTTAKTIIIDPSSTYEVKVNSGSYPDKCNCAGQFTQSGGLYSYDYTYDTEFKIIREYDIDNNVNNMTVYSNNILVGSYTKPIVTNTNTMYLFAKHTTGTEPSTGLIRYIGFKWLS